MITLLWKVVLITSILISISGIGIYYTIQVHNSSHIIEFNTGEDKSKNESLSKYHYNSSNIQTNHVRIQSNQENPIAISLRLSNYCNEYIQTKNLTKLEYIKNDANSLVVNALNYGNYSLYEYNFSSDHSMTGPIHSALAQGFAIQALTKSYEITQNDTYLNKTISLVNSFYVNVKDGGINQHVAANGLWYEEFADNNNANPHGLTGMMYVLLALHDYYHYTKNVKSEYLFNQGVEALKKNISNYDDAGNSYDDALSIIPIDYSHHVTQVDLLSKLYDITGESIFKEYSDKWKSHIDSNGNYAVLTKLPAVASNNVKIAIIKNTFTGGAYNNAFYNFYGKYETWPSRKNITNDDAYSGFHLNLLTGIIPDYDIGGYNTWYIPFMKRHIQSILPGTSVTVLNDEDVHNGLIFGKNGTNAYNLLILGHQEYVTQKEYDNLRSFVTNGGKIIFLDGNIFYAEVSYDQDTSSVTLIKGHGWKYDGSSASKTILERWFDETSKWVGGNYIPLGNVKINFTNNVFKYIHDEETYVNNPDDIIILDYGVKIPNDLINSTYTLHYPDSLNYGAYAQKDLGKQKIATYELNYGKGNVINLGIYGENKFGDSKFNSFFDSLLKGILSNEPSSYIYAVPK